MSTPRVSVVMIFLDAERFIAEAIDSVLAQTYPHWELILVDDGSTDGSSRIAQRYSADHPHRIRYFDHPGHANLGTGAARNAGIETARGEYVTFLDADDCYLPRRLERHMDVIDRQPGVGLVVSHDLYWRSWREPPDRLTPWYDEVLGPYVEFGVPMDPPALLTVTLGTRHAVMPATCGITFRRDSALAYGGIPAEFSGQYEDQVLICQLMLTSRAVVLEDCLARYRQHPQSLTGQARARGEYRPGRAHLAQFQFLLWLDQFIRREALGTPALNAALHRQLWPARNPRLNVVREVALDGVRGLKLIAHAIAARLIPRPLAQRMMTRYLQRRQNAARRTASRNGRPRG